MGVVAADTRYVDDTSRRDAAVRAGAAGKHLPAVGEARCALTVTSLCRVHHC